MRHELKIRASMMGLLMTEPKTLKEGPLSVGAKTAIRNIAAQDILGVDFEVSDKKLEKGILVELDNLALFNSVFGRAAVKNTERRSDDYFTGEADVLDDDEVVDLKSAWSAATFPILMEDVERGQRVLYEFQGRVYMRLWNKPRFRIAYGLVDTPESLIGNFEPLPLHVVSHIPEHLRMTSWAIDRDPSIEAVMVEKVKHARTYYADVIAEFDRTHYMRRVQRAQVPAAAAAISNPPFSIAEPAVADLADADF
jgi:hypothetical protein